jgi:hypothetical protein
MDQSLFFSRCSITAIRKPGAQERAVILAARGTLICKTLMGKDLHFWHVFARWSGKGS